ncbi:hypothetical protein NDU88_002264 [Pleurodeles waltl]|uniref:Uncharacterized protein n=1 Tax=Pleurodeles waltl TaxID=8319 RepID=A0AAV7TK85_PLEWA|nr:hypothetical protein NDU88_002264 [Pleurodeles waltl]
MCNRYVVRRDGRKLCNGLTETESVREDTQKEQCIVRTSARGGAISLVVRGCFQLSAAGSGAPASALVVHARRLAPQPSSASLTVCLVGRDTGHSGCRSRRRRTPEDNEVGESEVLRYQPPTPIP